MNEVVLKGGGRRAAGVVLVVAAGVVIGGALLGVVLLGGGASDEDRAPGYSAGAVWDGKARQAGSLSQAAAEAFDDYPVLWPGPSVGGFNLQAISANTPAEQGIDEVSMVYGSCDLRTGPGRPSCTAPGSIHVRPLCAVLPEQLAGRYSPETVRGGAFVARQPAPPGGTSTGAILWTGAVSISLSFPVDGSLVDRAIEQLESLNHIGPAIAEADPLPRPAFETC